ncbi:MAG TPA: hypothetical protein DG761_01020 [Gammaproteobacteria bacterium]|nr:hypothetical protein [Gammaproteobacteria bacterium]|tara:strand:- start:51 stop:1172 length:1122 start_codon:yes stop_codon:yes gene_type:complete
MARKRKQPTLKQHENGFWYVHHDGGRRSSLFTADADEAEIAFARWLTNRNQLETLTDQPLMTEIFKVYQDQRIHGSREDGTPFVTASERVDIVLRWGCEFFRGLRVSEIDKDCIKRYSAARRTGKVGNKAGPGTIRKELGQFAAACNWMVRNAEPVSIRMSPTLIPPFTVMMPPRPPAKDRVILEGEMDKMLVDARKQCILRKEKRLSRIERFLWMAFGTGARGWVIEGLPWSQIDLERGIIDFQPKGRVETKKRNPKVPIADDLMPILERAYTERRSDWYMDHTGSIRTAFENFCKRWGYEEVTKHTIRHSFITQKVMAGVSLAAVAAMAGDDVQTITENYLHLAPDHLRDAVNARLSGTKLEGDFDGYLAT